VWKDPRNCLTFALWVGVLEVDPVVLLVYRNPLEIAASLRVRSGEAKVYALALWSGTSVSPWRRSPDCPSSSPARKTCWRSRSKAPHASAHLCPTSG